jgi:segregation and condensation protein A
MLPEVSVDDLRAAWADIMKRAKLNQHHHITREQLSVRDHMTHILRRLNDVRFMEFGDLFMERVREGAPAAVVVVHFIAMLELARESLLEITQAEPYAPIYVRLAYTSVAAVAA